eukprot:2796226-Prymnesium_polylepis.3
MPARKEPLTNEIIKYMMALFMTGKKIGDRTVDMSHPAWASLAALFATMAQTGFRKAEVSLSTGASWTRAHIRSPTSHGSSAASRPRHRDLPDGGAAPRLAQGRLLPPAPAPE